MAEPQTRDKLRTAVTVCARRIAEIEEHRLQPQSIEQLYLLVKRVLLISTPELPTSSAISGTIPKTATPKGKGAR